jgi:hypothetical protein
MSDNLCSIDFYTGGRAKQLAHDRPKDAFSIGRILTYAPHSL